MDEVALLLHNMSAPPRTTIRYDGLAQLSGGGGGDADANHGPPAWRALCVRLPDGCPTAVGSLADALGIQRGEGAAREIAALLDRHARALPLPDGCLVLPAARGDCDARADLPTALAVLTKCSEYVWLREKAPSLSRLERVRAVALWLPTAVALQLSEEKP